MKKLTVLLFVLLMCCACAPEKEEDSGRMTVYTSFCGMYDFAKTVAGESAEVKVLIPAGVEAHDWEPGTTDMLELSSADIFVYSSDNMEPWAAELLENLDNDGLEVVVASEGIAESKENTDPHVWLNPEYAVLQMKNITEAFCKKDPENAEIYRANFETAQKEISGIDGEFKLAAAEFDDRELIVTHGAFGYLCEAYGMKQRVIEGAAGESDPSCASVREIVDYMKENGKRSIFYVTSEGDAIAKSVAAETGASLYPLDPFESNGEKSYIEVMKENLEVLKRAFGSYEE